MTDDLNRLRAVAQAATPGPWYQFASDDGLDILSGDVTDEGHVPHIATANTYYDDANAEHIATFDPPTVLALLDRVERAETERDRLEADWGNAGHDLAELRAAVAPRQDVLYPQKWAFGAATNYEMGVRDERARLRSLLAAAPTETEGTPRE